MVYSLDSGGENVKNVKLKKSSEIVLSRKIIRRED